MFDYEVDLEFLRVLGSIVRWPIHYFMDVVSELVSALGCRIDDIPTHDVAKYGVSIESDSNLLGNAKHFAGPFNPQFDTLDIQSLIGGVGV